MSAFENFTNLYSLSKTLRFELRPEPESQDKVQELFKSNGNGCPNDFERAESYKQVKLLIDCRHREIINNVLKTYSLTENELNKLNKSDSEDDDLEIDGLNDDKKDAFKKIRERLSSELNKHASAMFKKELINSKKDEKCELEEWLETADDEQLDIGNNQRIDRKNIIKDIENMKGFWTYFGGFNENRRNIYSKDKIPTSIPFRIVNTNFPIFEDNIDNYIKIMENYPDLQKMIDEKGANEIFTLEYFNKCLTQNGIDIYNNEKLGIIAKKQGEEQSKGINQIINEYVQEKNKEIKEKTQKGEKPKKIKVAVFEKLKKQILSIRKTSSFQFEIFENTTDIVNGINGIYKNFIELKSEIVKFLNNINQYDLNEIYLNEKFINILSKKIFKDGRHIELALKDKEIKEGKWYSIETIQNTIGENKVIDYFKNPTITTFVKKNNNENGYESEEKNLFEEIETRAKNIEYILNGTYHKDLKEEKGKDSENVKSFLDALLEFNYILSPFVAKSKSFKNTEKDEEFYNARKQLQEHIWDLEISDLYNQTRNYITKKAYSLDKVRLIFDESNLLKWSKKELGMLLRKDDDYYVAISNDNKILKTIVTPPKNSTDVISIMDYEQVKAGQLIQNLMVIEGKTEKKNGHKLDLNDLSVKYDSREYTGVINDDFFEVNIDGELLSVKIDDKDNSVNIELEKLKNKYLPKDINEIRKSGSYNSGKNFNKENSTKFIDFYKERINDYYKDNSFKFKNSKEYENFKDFTDSIDEQAYQLNFKETSFTHIKSLAIKGDIYLFKIHNKDFKEHAKGNRNLHTLYWQMLFDKKNLQNATFKLNGEGHQIFVRRAQDIKNNTIHKKGEKIPKKWFNGKPVSGNVIKRLNKYVRENIPEDKWEEGDKLYKENFVTRKVDIIKDNRFTKDTYLFHCSITMNFSNKNEKSINRRVLDFLYNKNKDVHIIGLDRGERNLIYLTMIDKEGNIVDGMQFSLNELNNINYNDLLQSKETNRIEARKNWQTIENIKDLKEGYLSLVIHNLAKFIVEKNAIIVMENLNYGFKDSRAKIEKSIYQKFESMLIKKLQYMVMDKKNLYERGGVLHAYQLVNEKIPAYKDICFQNGFLFYVPADYTSKIDPKTGFVNLLDTRFFNKDKALKFIEKFEKIYYHKSNGYFRFEFDYTKFDKLRVDVSELPKTNWSICSHSATRSISTQINNKWVREKIDVNAKLKELFKDFSYENGNDLKESISKMDANFFEKLLKYLSVLLALRHTWKEKDGEEKDTIVSSVEYAPNKFFNSEYKDRNLPIDADANGAYNIARKGLMLIERIKNTENLKKIDLAITNKEYLQFVQNK